MSHNMHSSLQRLNHISSLATTYVMILLGLISITSYFTSPTVQPGKVEIRDLIVQKGRLNRWSSRTEELASLRFDIRTDLQPLLNSYNTKQLFLYLTAAYAEPPASASPIEQTPVSDAGARPLGSPRHEVVVWDRIITRRDMRDIRAVGKALPRQGGGRRGRGNVRVEEGKNKYAWRNPSGTFKDIPSANLTLHYSLMPYVGILTSGVAATALGPVEIPELIKR